MRRAHPLQQPLFAFLASLAIVAGAAAVRPALVHASSLIVVTTTHQEVNGDAACSLEEAIYAANFDASIAPDPALPLGGGFVTTGCAAGSGADTIALPAGGVFPMTAVLDDVHNPFGPTATPIVFSSIDIEGNGSRLESAASVPFRAFAVGQASVDLNPGGPPAVVSGIGNLTVRNLHVKGFSARGGDGGVDGGGGLGAGGAIYVRGGALTVEASTFEANHAQGGNGGSSAHTGGGGGGGGLGGNGGSGIGQVYDDFQTSAGGGGGGARGDGGTTESTGPFGQIKPSNFGGGGGGTVSAGEGTDGIHPPGRAGGVACGGDGGDFWGNGADGCDGGGGGGGGQPTYTLLCGTEGGAPGGGGYGGGGGGGATRTSTRSSVPTCAAGPEVMAASAVAAGRAPHSSVAAPAASALAVGAAAPPMEEAPAARSVAMAERTPEPSRSP